MSVILSCWLWALVQKEKSRSVKHSEYANLPLLLKPPSPVYPANARDQQVLMNLVFLFFRSGRRASEEIEEYVSSFPLHPLVTLASSAVLVVIIYAAFVGLSIRKQNESGFHLGLSDAHWIQGSVNAVSLAEGLDPGINVHVLLWGFQNRMSRYQSADPCILLC